MLILYFKSDKFYTFSHCPNIIRPIRGLKNFIVKARYILLKFNEGI